MPSTEAPGGGAAVQASGEKTARQGATSTEKATADVTSARGLGGRQRTSTIETIPQTPASNPGQVEGSIAEGRRDLLGNLLFSISEESLGSHKESVPQPGSLIAEIYSWKSLSMGQPILRLHSTATKAALLTLPPGSVLLLSCRSFLFISLPGVMS